MLRTHGILTRIRRTAAAHKVRCITGFSALLLFAAYWFSLPSELFAGTSYSTTVCAEDGTLLGARIAEDGQWRFPPSGEVPEKFAAAIVLYEDKNFRYHPGVDPLAAARALYQNFKADRIISGGSTITMQVIRLSRRKERTIWQKLIESVLATRLEIRCSKDEILSMYAAHAPFGGNVVGIDAASWRYFGHPADGLSWAEAATLAVLPNAPAMIHPGKNRNVLKHKRDHLLKKLRQKDIIDEITYSLSVSEPLPEKPVPLPCLAPHLTERYAKTHKGKTIRTGIDSGLQQQVGEVAERWHTRFEEIGINDLAIIVMDVHSGQTVAYCGNVGFGSGRNGSQVDAVTAPRSTGSILKPFLYIAALQEGIILPHTLLPDIPMNINGFSPQNFDRNFYGAVAASEALARSLNIPAVHLLRDYGVPKFKELLEEAGMTTLTRPASDYGLSLILGGAEGTLEEITGIYRILAASLQGAPLPEGFPLKDKAAVFCTFEALKEVNRPDEMDWRLVASVRKVAWKTGTSYGFRDAWAVGVTPDYAVGVWAGNAEGQGSPSLTGARTAGPVMFDVFNLLPSSNWFESPAYGEYATAEICRESGHLKGMYCNDCDTLIIPRAGLRSEPCPYHKAVTITSDGKNRCSNAVPGSVTVNMFILPPVPEWYYKKHHPEYTPLPPPLPGSITGNGYVPMGFIYPENGSTIRIPRQLDGSIKGVTFRLAHNDPSATVYWHIDNNYIGETKYIHTMTVVPNSGKHTVTAVDGDGYSLSVGFTIERP